MKTEAKPKAKGQPAPKKATVTALHKEEARLLHALWVKAGRPNQGVLGDKFDIGGQSAVSNFLRGHSALSIEAARGFARAFDVDIAAFSKRLALEAARLGSVAGMDESITDVRKLDTSEFQLLTFFRGLDATQKHDVLVELNRLYVLAHPEVSQANPFAGITPPGQLTNDKESGARVRHSSDSGAKTGTGLHIAVSHAPDGRQLGNGSNTHKSAPGKGASRRHR